MAKGNRGKATLGDADGGKLAALKAMLLKAAPKQSTPTAAAKTSCAASKVHITNSHNRVPPPTQAAADAYKHLRKKITKTVLKMPGGAALAEQVKAQFPASSASKVEPAVDAPEPCSQCFKKVVQAVEEATAHKISLSKPERVSPETAAEVSAAIQRGAELAGRGYAVEEGGFFIGYDLGTSSTKVVLRKPYDIHSQAFAVPVPEEMMSGSCAHLWHTAIWIASDGSLSLLPRNGHRMIDGFKGGLLAGHGNRFYPGGQLTYAEATVAFLAMHLAYVLGIAETELGRGVTFERIHQGVPVAALKDQKIARYFAAVMHRALLLVPYAQDLNIEDVRQILASSEAGEAPLPHDSFPELVAAITGYSKTRDARPGPHMLIDVGAGTLDMATFHLPISNTQALPIHVAKVEPLGAEACDWAMAAADVSEMDCKRACSHQERQVHSPTVLTKDAIGFGKLDDYYTYGVVTIGGGRRSRIHDSFLTQLASAFSRDFIEPTVLKGLRHSADAETDRLILADGLANDPIEIRQWLLPDDHDAMASSKMDYSTLFVGKDQV